MTTGRGDPDLVAPVARLWDAVMLAGADRPVPATVLEAGSVLRPAASAASIAAVVGRIGLPESYRGFLELSDGALANGCGVVTRSGEYGLLPVGLLGRVADVAAEHVRLWVETFGNVAPEPGSARVNGQDVGSFGRFGEAILLTPMVDAICECLVPVAAEFDAGGEGFEVWATFKEGATRYLTFRSWLESMITTRWVARNDQLVRSLLPEVGEHLAGIDRWVVDPNFHWFAVGQVRRLAAAPAGDRQVTKALDRLWAGNDPYLRLAAAQAELGHRRDRAKDRLAELASTGARPNPEPTVVLAAAATLTACDHPMLEAAIG